MPPLPLNAPLGSAGPAGPQTGNPGLTADALSKVREAVNLLNMSVAHLPVGSEEHKMVIKMITDGSKIAPASQAVPGVQQTQLAGLQQAAQKDAMLQAVMRSMASGGGQGGQPPQAATPAEAQ